VSAVSGVCMLEEHHNAEMLCDPSDPVVDESVFQLKNWTSSEFGHPQGKEDLPPNMPEPHGQGFVIDAKVNACQTANAVTRQSRTGFFVCLNCAPVCCSFEKQTSCKSSSFGSEFAAMKQCCKCLQGL
jgi:hypothetical protein